MLQAGQHRQHGAAQAVAEGHSQEGRVHRARNGQGRRGAGKHAPRGCISAALEHFRLSALLLAHTLLLTGGHSHPYSTSWSGGERGMKPGSVNAVMASMDREKVIHTAEMATTAQEMWGPTQGSTHAQKITAAAGREGLHKACVGAARRGRKCRRCKICVWCALQACIDWLDTWLAKRAKIFACCHASCSNPPSARSSSIGVPYTPGHPTDWC